MFKHPLLLVSLILGLIFSATALLSCTPLPDSDAYPTYSHYTQNAKHRNLILLHGTSYQQTTSYTCGPAVIMTLLHYYGRMPSSDLNRNTEMQLAREMGTTNSGTSLDRMAAWLQAHGFSVDFGQGISVDQIRQNLAEGTPTIIIWNDWGGHALLVIGYDSSNPSSTDDNHDVMIMADPSSSSYITEGNLNLYGINTKTPEQLEFDWFQAKYMFNPLHIATGMYIVAKPLQ